MGWAVISGSNNVRCLVLVIIHYTKYLVFHLLTEAVALHRVCVSWLAWELKDGLQPGTSACHLLFEVKSEG